MNVPDPMTPDEMADRYNALLKLRDEVDSELQALSEGLRVHGRWLGAPRKAAVMSSEEAKRAHAAHARGDKSDWAMQGERQYQRDAKRRAAERKNRQNTGAAKTGAAL